jgi:hypothetical protein
MKCSCGLLFLGWLAGACGYSLSDPTILAPATPMAELPAVQLPPWEPAGTLLFTFDGNNDTGQWWNLASCGGLPDADNLEAVRRKAAQLGATVLLADCGSPGTVGACRCTFRGYRE